MTAADFIGELSRLPPDTDIYVCNSYGEFVAADRIEFFPADFHIIHTDAFAVVAGE